MRRVLPAALLAACLLTGCNSGGTSAWPGVGATDDAVDQGDWTILLCTLRDPALHVQHAEVYRKRLTEALGWKGVFTINKGGHSEVYWGRYANPEAAQKNFKAARAHTTRADTKPFGAAMIVPLPGQDYGPRAWNLKYVQGEYTLLVATFQDDPERNYLGRKKKAVDYCRRLRKAGYQAYFEHRPSASLVTIGAFGRNSIRISKTPEGKKLEVLDPKIKALQRDFPNLQVNGNTVSKIAYDRQTGQRIRFLEKTYLTAIRRDGDSRGS